MARKGDQILRTYARMIYEFCTSYLSLGCFTAQPTGKQMQRKGLGCAVH